MKKPGLDNHWFDCLVGATVAASVEGVQVPGTEFHVGRKRRKCRHFGCRTSTSEQASE
ncbi:MAG: hypothetical protein JNM94_11850 [Phycisphaerae bacterium]|nr:hypothetical protein [Phycisphaerae bacterium]